MTPSQIAAHPIAVERANREPLPGALAGAFDPMQSIKVGDYTIRPIVAGDYTLIKKLNSPVYRQILELQKENGGEEVQVDDVEQWELIYILTNPPEHSLKLLYNGGNIRDKAIETLGAKLGPLLVADLFIACIQQFKTHMETMLSYAAAKEGKEGDENFTTATAVTLKTA